MCFSSIEIKQSDHRRSCQARRNVKSGVAMIPGKAMGMMIRREIGRGEAPSTGLAWTRLLVT